MKMKISVIVPIYNVEEYLEECLDSVIAQTFSDWEMILVDDGSTDSSGEIAEKYAQQYDNVFVIHQVNGGLSAARNTGLDIAKGEYIYFLDSDDYILDNTLQIAYETAEKNSAELVIFNGIDFYKDKEDICEVHFTNFNSYDIRISGRDVFNETVANNGGLLFCAWSQFVKRSLLEKINLRFKAGMLHEDDLYSFYLLMNVESVVVIKDILHMRRVHDGSITNTRVSIRNLEGYYIIYTQITMWLNENIVDETLHTNIYRYLRLFFMEIVNGYYMLTRDQHIRFRDSYYKIIKTAASNNYNNDKYVRLICRHKIAYGIYQYMKRIINR